MGAIASVERGCESYEKYYSNIKKCNMYQYDYRAMNGDLFTCVRKTLEECRKSKDAWLNSIGA